MALVDLKSKLNKFGKNKNTPDNPYLKGDRESDLIPETGDVSINIVPPNTFDLRRNKYVPRIDDEPYLEEGQKPESELTKLDSDFDRENTPKSKIERDKKSSFGRSLKSFVEDFGRSSFDVPTTGNYEDSIKIESSDSLGNLARGAKSIENTVKAAKDILKGNVSKGIRTALEGTQDNKLREYNAKAYGIIKHMGEPGRKVSNIDRTLSEGFEGPIKGGVTSKNVNRANIQPIQKIEEGEPKDKDLVPFRFYDVNKSRYITFSAILSGITDTVTPEYSSEKYIGRPENVYVYQGVTRALSFTFDVFPQTRQEMPVLWEKINYLVSLCYTDWITSPWPTQTGDGYLAQTMVSPMTELTIGDMYRRTPGFLSSVTMTVQDGSTWEFEEGMKLPHYVQISCEFTHIPKRKPEVNGSHFALDWTYTEEEKSTSKLFKGANERHEQFKKDLEGGMSKKEAKAFRKASKFETRADKAFDRGNRDREGRLLDKSISQWDKILGFDDE